MIQPLRTTFQQFLIKLNANSPYDIVIPIQGIYRKEMKIYAQGRIVQNHDKSFAHNSCRISSPLQGHRTQNLWLRQELSDPYHSPTHLFIMPSPSFEQPSLLLPAPCQEMYVGHSSPCHYMGNIYPQSTSKCVGRSHCPPTNQQVSSCILIPLLSPWAIKTDTTRPLGSAFPDHQEVVLLHAVSLTSINSSFSLPCYASGNSFSNLHKDYNISQSPKKAFLFFQLFQPQNMESSISILLYFSFLSFLPPVGSFQCHCYQTDLNIHNLI